MSLSLWGCCSSFALASPPRRKRLHVAVPLTARSPLGGAWLPEKSGNYLLSCKYSANWEQEWCVAKECIDSLVRKHAFFFLRRHSGRQHQMAPSSSTPPVSLAKFASVLWRGHSLNLYLIRNGGNSKSVYSQTNSERSSTLGILPRDSLSSASPRKVSLDPDPFERASLGAAKLVSKISSSLLKVFIMSTLSIGLYYSKNSKRRKDNETTTLRGFHSVAMFCYVFFRKFWFPIGLQYQPNGQ